MSNEQFERDIQDTRDALARDRARLRELREGSLEWQHMRAKIQARLKWQARLYQLARAGK